MESPVTFESREKYLLVTGHGQRNSLSSMVEASEMIFSIEIFDDFGKAECWLLDQITN